MTDGAPSDAPPDRCADDVGPQGLYIHLSCTGLYADIGAKTIAADARYFKPGVPFWSDGADKTRYIRLPAGKKIDSTDIDNWIFPVGTSVWKEFILGGKRIETRLYVKTQETLWKRTSYRWSADEKDAIRNDDGERNVNGTNLEIPPAEACDNCHFGGGKDRLLGFEAVNLALPTAEGLTLERLALEGVLTRPPARTKFDLPEDATKFAAPALGYLHSNCGTCHSHIEGAPAGFSGLDVRLYASRLLAGVGPKVAELEAYRTTVGVEMSVFKKGPLLRIKSGDPVESGVVFLSARRTGEAGNDQMPPFASHEVDTAGVKLLSDWIKAGP